MSITTINRANQKTQVTASQTRTVVTHAQSGAVTTVKGGSSTTVARKGAERVQITSVALSGGIGNIDLGTFN